MSRLKKITKASREDLTKNAGFYSIVVDDFYEAFRNAVVGLKQVKPKKAETHLIKLLGNN